VAEIRRLLLALAEPPEQRAVRLRWSTFRRTHQASAARGHTARRAAQLLRLPPSALPDAGDAASLILPETAALTEARWQRIRVLLPPRQPPRGRPRLEHRRMLEGMLWVMRSGRPWRDLPPRFGRWQSLYGRYQQWRRDGLWQHILAVLHPDGDRSLFDP
jgi:transposase